MQEADTGRYLQICLPLIFEGAREEGMKCLNGELDQEGGLSLLTFVVPGG